MAETDPEKPPMISDEDWKEIKAKQSDPNAFDGTSQPLPLTSSDKGKNNGTGNSN